MYLENMKFARHTKKTKVVDDCIPIHCTNLKKKEALPEKKKYFKMAVTSDLFN